MSDIDIIIKAILDKPSLETIDSQLNAIKEKYTNSVISIKFDTDVLKNLQEFTSAFQKFQVAQSRTIEQTQDVYKKLDGSVTTVTKSINTLGEITTKTKNVHDENKKAMQDESFAALKLAEGVQAANKAELDSITVMKNKANAISGFNVKSSQGYSVTNNRLEADGQTLVNSRTTTNYQKERQDIDQIESYRIESENKRLAREREMNASQQQSEYDAKVKAYEDTKNFQDKIDKDHVIANQKNINLDQDIADKKFALETKIINMKRRFGEDVDTKGLDELSTKIKTVDGTTVNAQRTLKNMGQEIDRFGASVKTSGSHVIDFGEQLKYALNRLPSYALIGGAIGGVSSFFKDGIQYVMDYNKALTLISTTTNKSSAEVQQLGRDFQQMGIQMGVTSKEIADGSIEFFRNKNLSDDEVKKDMQTVIEYSRISGMAVQDSSKVIIAAMNTMKMSATGVSDVFTAVGDSVSSSANTIGTAFQYVGGEAESINIPMQKTSAYIAVLSATTKRSAEEIGTAIKSIYARAESLKTTGFNEDGQDKTQVAKALDSIGVKLFDSAGQFRNFGTVLDETGKKWGNLDTAHRQYISTVLGGVYQASNFNILMQNYAQTLTVTDIAMQSAGTTAQKFASYQEGAAAHTDRLRATLEKLWSDSFKTNGIIGIVDSLTGMISTIDSVVSKLGLFPPVLGAIGAALVLLNKEFRTSVVEMTVFESAMKGLTISAEALKIGLKSLMTATIVGAAFVALGFVIEKVVAAFTSMNSGTATLSDTLKKNQSDIISLSNQYNSLTKEIDGNKLSSDELAKKKQDLVTVTQKLADTLPNLVTQWDAEGKAIDINKGKLDEYIAKYADTIKFTTQTDLNKNISKKADLQKSLDEENMNVKDAGEYQRTPWDVIMGRTVDDLKYKAGVKAQNLISQISDVDKAIKEGQDTLDAIDKAQNPVTTPKTSTSTTPEVEPMTYDKAKQTLSSDLEDFKHLVTIKADGYKSVSEQIAKLNAIRGSSYTSLLSNKDLYSIDEDIYKLKNPDKPSGGGSNTPSQEENIANNPYQRNSKILEGALKSSEAAMTHYNSTSKEYRDELQKQYEIQLKQRELEHAEADRIRAVNDELKNQLNTEQLSATQRKQINKQIEDNSNSITDLGEKWQQDTLNAEDYLKKKSSSLVDETIQNLDAETKIYDDKIKNLKTAMSSLKNDPAEKISDQGKLIQTYFEENTLILKHVEALNAESATLDKNSDAWKKNQDQIAKEKAKYEQNNADVESVREKIATDTVDLIKKGLETQRTSELFIENERHNNKVKNLDDEYQKQIDNIDRLQATQDFNKNLAKDDTDAAKIQAEIDARSNDNSNDGKSRVIDLKQKLADIQEKITDEQAKRQNEIVKQGLQDQNKSSKELEDQKNQTTVDGINEKYDTIINDDTKWLGIEKSLIEGHTTEVKTQMEGLITSLGKFAEDNATVVGAHVSAVKQMVDELTGAKIPLSQLTINSTGTSSGTPQSTGTGSSPTAQSMTWQESLAKATIDDAYAASEIKRAQAVYNTDKLNGDIAGADAAHKWADQIRAANPNVASMDTGGYTGNFSGSKYLLAHEKELMLNKNDTSNMLKIIDMVRNIMPDFSRMTSKGSSQIGGNTYSVSFGDIYVTGDEKGAQKLFDTFENGLRRKGVNMSY